jgi:hypothetical protein
MPEKTLTCSICGIGFNSTRSDARYCSNKCRQKEHRESTKRMLKSISVSNKTNFYEETNSKLEKFYSHALFPLMKPKDFYHGLLYDMYGLAKGLKIEYYFYDTGYVIDTTEKSKKYSEDIDKFKNTILDKWHRGTDEEKASIFACYIRWATNTHDLADLYYILYHPET